MSNSPKSLSSLSPEKRQLLALLLKERDVKMLPQDTIRPRTESACPALSFAQQRLWFLDQLEPGSSFYNLPSALRLTGPLDATALARSLAEIVRRHESLRTTFQTIGEQPVQMIAPNLELALPRVDLEALPELERENELRRRVIEEAQQSFDLTHGPLIRTTLLRLGAEEHALLVTIHHIVSDGWSTDIFFRELAALYEAEVLGRPSPLPKLPVQYADYALWQRERLLGKEIDRQLSYWKERLGGTLPILELPTDRPRPAVQTYRGAYESIRLSGKLTEELKALAQREGATLFMILLAAYQTMLSRYTNQDDILVGSPIANRQRVETEGLIGFFLNTLVLRTDLSGDPTFREVLGRARETTLGAYEHQDVPFEKLVEALQPERSLSRNPLFQVTFVLRNAPRQAPKLQGLQTEPLESDIGASKFDLSLSMVEEPDGLKGSLEYSTDLFNPETIERMIENFGTLLQGVVDTPDRPVWELPLLAEAERRRVIVDWNRTERDYPTDKTLQALFEEQVEKTPDAEAIVFGDERLTYRELNQLANRLAWYLAKRGVGPDVVVAICAERSPALVVGLLGILKAGGAYLPLDRTYPPQRLAFMLQDAAAPVVLTQAALAAVLPEDGFEQVRLDADWGDVARESPENPPHRSAAENLAYVIYTSGSTGAPKGVMIPHAGICNRLIWMQEAYRLTPDDRVLQKTPFSFDVSVWEFFWTLLNGAKLVLAAPGEHRDSVRVAELIDEEKITIAHFVPSMLRIFLEGLKPGQCGSLRQVICSGEALPPEVQRRFFQRLESKLANLYGPTEASVDVTFWPCAPDDAGPVVPIGRPIANTQTYVLNRMLKPVPIGVPGELWIGGVGLARGYLNRPELTAKKFRPNPFLDPPARIYHSGDLARFRADGNLEFLGREDDQVKIRGHRIELGEIESTLGQHPGVQEVVVVAREDAPGDKRLVAYVVPDQKSAYSVRQLLRLEREGLLTHHSRYELPNGMLIVHQNKHETDLVYHELFASQSYLRNGITIQDGDCIFDVGANIGLFTLFVGNKYKSLTIYAFEPIPPIFQLLLTNTTLYGLNAKLFDCGISNEAKAATFTYYPRVSILSGGVADLQAQNETVRAVVRDQLQTPLSDTEPPGQALDELLQERLVSEHFICELRSISDVIQENGVERIDLLKIDVAKSELDVLAGIWEDDWPKIRQIIVEVHDTEGRLEHIKSLLQRRGYDLTIEPANVRKDAELYDIYAVRPSTEQKVSGGSGDMPAAESMPTWSSPNRLLSDLRYLVTESLPEYMVPSAFVLLEALPMTPSGKVDRRALPTPGPARPELERTYEAPRTPVESVLAEIWGQLLRLQQVGIHDNFFALGGHSLLATQVISRVREVLRIDLPLRALFESPSVAAMAGRIEAAQQNAEGLQSPPLRPVQRDKPLPLAYAQEPLWFADQLRPGNASYNVPRAIRMRGVLNRPALRQALDSLVSRHETLRTIFADVDGTPLQLIAAPGGVAFKVIDLSGLPQSEAVREVRRLVDEEVQRSFDLARGPLFRAALLQLGNEDQVLFVNMHHIISDAWSIGVMFKELSTLYESFSGGTPSPLPELPIQYADYAVWQREWLRGEVLERQVAYWKRQLAGAPPVLNLPTDRSRIPGHGVRGARQLVNLPKELADSLKVLSRSEGVTLFMLLLAVFQLLLSRYTGETDIVVGTDVANRNRLVTEGLIGFFINNVVMRTDLSGDPTFRELLSRVREMALSAYAHQDLPFNKVVEALNPERRLDHNPIFQVLFVLQNAPASPLTLPGMTVTPIEIDSHTSKFDLAIFTEETDQYLTATWSYKTDLFEDSTISRMAIHFETLLRSCVARPDAPLSCLEMLTERERNEKAMETKQRQEAQAQKFRGVRRKALDLSQVSSVKTSFLRPDGTMPLVLQPNLADVNLADWARNNLGLIAAKLQSHGAILFRGFAVSSPAEFERVAASISPELFGEYGDLPRESVSGNVYRSTPYPSDQAILFHNESSHMHRWPMKIWFYCVQAARQGGETPIVDIRKVYQRLDPSLRNRFREKKLMYVRNYIGRLDVSWQSFFQTTDKQVVEDYCRKVGLEFEWKGADGLRTRQLGPAIARHPAIGEMVFFNQIQLHHVCCLEPAVRESLLSMFPEEDLPRNVYYGDGSRIEDSVVAEIVGIYRELEVKEPWQEGDIIMLDNMLTAHARAPFVGPRKIVVSMGEIVNQQEVEW